jgi:predicted transcriptional regulator
MTDSVIVAQIVSAIIIAAGNFAGLYVGFRRIERKIDKKIEQYTNDFRKSKEGATFLEVMSDLQKLLKSEESKDLLEGLTEATKELRSFLKQLSERAAQPEEDEEEEEVLPTLTKKKKET